MEGENQKGMWVAQVVRIRAVAHKSAASFCKTSARNNNTASEFPSVPSFTWGNNGKKHCSQNTTEKNILN